MLSTFLWYIVSLLNYFGFRYCFYFVLIQPLKIYWQVIRNFGKLQVKLTLKYQHFLLTLRYLDEQVYTEVPIRTHFCLNLQEKNLTIGMVANNII